MVGVIIQARMQSNRLPGKVLKPILNRPMLYYIIQRLKKVRYSDKLIVATSANEQDKRIVDFCKKNDVEYFIGSNEDVLDRYYQAAKNNHIDIIIRATADDPFVDPMIVDRAIDIFIKNSPKPDFVCNNRPYTFPVGLDVEVISVCALKIAWEEARDSTYREHVTPFIWSKPERFNIINFENKKDYSNLRWTVDYPQDFKFAKIVYEKLYPQKPIFLMEDILGLLYEAPNLVKINANIKPIPGWKESFTKAKLDQ